MRKIYLIVFIGIFFINNKLFANDTLTRAQVYNFAVGDTFDYKDSSVYDGFALLINVSYHRYIVDRIYMQSDTMIIVRKNVYPLPVSYDSLVIVDTGTYEVFNYFPFIQNYMCDTTIETDTQSVYYGKGINRLAGMCFEQYFEYQFCEGLGRVYDLEGGGNSTDNFTYENQRELIYYSGSNGIWGTPILNSDALLHYTPIPEECAVWTDDIYSDYPWMNPPRDLGIREQIRTGLRVPYHGHTYVEMIYRSYDYRNNTYTPDSLLGYFRNDTANAKALFYHSLTDSSFMEYDFSYLCPAPNCLSQVMVGGQPRTRWPDYIEGVGGVKGLIPVKEISFTPQIGLPPHKWGASYFSFCVCGQMLYTTDSTISCDLISGINDEKLGINNLTVFPIPAKQLLNLSFSITEADFFTARILDLQGKTVSPDYNFGKLSEGTHTEQINLPPLSSGMYFLECSTAKGKLYERLVVE